jgi:hypothetical protein
MNVAIVAESPADEAAIFVFAKALLGVELKSVISRLQRPGGIGALRRELRSIVREIYYNTDAEALLVVADSDDSPPHRAEHESEPDAKCRLCDLTQIVNSTLATLSRKGRPTELRVAIGLAVPAIEAWLLCGTNVHVTEQAYARRLADGQTLWALRRELKALAYGTETPSRDVQKAHALHAAELLSTRLAELEAKFPGGFGPFANRIRSWRRTEA